MSALQRPAASVLHIRGVPELTTITASTGATPTLVVGAAVSIATLIDALVARAAESAVCAPVADHLSLVAGQQVDHPPSVPFRRVLPTRTPRDLSSTFRRPPPAAARRRSPPCKRVRSSRRPPLCLSQALCRRLHCRARAVPAPLSPACGTYLDLGSPPTSSSPRRCMLRLSLRVRAGSIRGLRGRQPHDEPQPWLRL